MLMHIDRRYLWVSVAAAFCVLTHASSQGQDASQTLADPPWKYTVTDPGDRWFTPEFDDSPWAEGAGGFGTRGTPGARIGTIWRKPDIWLRRTIDLASVPKNPALWVYHDEDAEIYLNGKQVAKLTGFVSEFKRVPLDPESAKALQAGKNLVAVHCHQTTGGQGIDVHVIDGDAQPQLPPVKRPSTPFKSELVTVWGEKVTPENAWQDYPRPQMKRAQWKNLNGHWDYKITARAATESPTNWDGKILVPFALESKLSGVQRLLNADESLWYHRTFDANPDDKNRTLLHFEAVDYRCDIYVNQKKVGSHKGGNVPFSIDVTDALKAGQNELVVRVDDNTEEFQLRGKQSLEPQGIFYTQVSGIWQTVWMESVPAQHIDEVKIATDADAGSISLRPNFAGMPADAAKVNVEVREGEKLLTQLVTSVGDAAKNGVTMTIENAKLWSPSTPHLYDVRVSLMGEDGKAVDTIETYAGIRTVGKERDADGHLRFTLNGKPVFHWGPLDQGWWPDGLLTPPSDEAMLFDIEYLKSAGFNMIRKHIKVEPRRYYYHCDRMGMLVWQDQVSGGANPPWTRLDPDPKDAQWSDEHHKQFMVEFEAMVDSLENHPSIVVWTPFNEAWGQHRTMEVGKWMVERDRSRHVNIASGGNFWPVGDVVDEHRYPHPGFPFNHERYENFIKVVGEFGGHGLPVDGHLWDAEADNWGYGGLPKNKTEYQERYRESIRILAELKAKGISAGVYTQTTDVEGEVNGLMSYDRKVIKIPAEELLKIHSILDVK